MQKDGEPRWNPYHANWRSRMLNPKPIWVKKEESCSCSDEESSESEQSHHEHNDVEAHLDESDSEPVSNVSADMNSKSSIMASSKSKIPDKIKPSANDDLGQQQ